MAKRVKKFILWHKEGILPLSNYCFNLMTKFSHSKMLLLLIITPVLLLLEFVIGLAVFASIQDINNAEKRSNKLDTYMRINGRYVSMAESAERGYLLTGDAKYRDTFNVCIAEILKNEQYYDTLEDDLKNATIEKIQAISAHKFAEMGQTIRLYDAGMKDSALTIVKSGTGKLMMDSIRTASRAIRIEIIDHIAAERGKEHRLFIYFFLLIAVLILFNIFLVRYTYLKFSGYAQKLETMVNSLEEANERMSEYTAHSYHELKTPLRNIHGFAQLLKSRYSHVGEEPTEEDEFIQYITDGIRQMNRTIDQMRKKYLDESIDDKNKPK